MNLFPTKILVATDGSEDAALAARAAMSLSNKSGSELHVVHTWTNVPSARFETYVRTQLEQESRRVLDEEVRRIEAAGGVVAKAHLRRGRTIDEILDLSEEIDAGLLMVGSRGLGRVKRVLMGSVSEGIHHHAQRPVLVMRGGDNAWPPARIVIADDSSEDAKKAGELAASIGEIFGASGLLVRVYPKRLESSGEANDVLREAERDLEDRARELEGILGRRPQTEIETAPGDPAAAILEVAEEGETPTLIAVGSRGLGMIQRIRLGSVSTKVMRAALNPVLVYPHHNGAQGH